jgi:hypothetical protein
MSPSSRIRIHDGPHTLSCVCGPGITSSIIWSILYSSFGTRRALVVKNSKCNKLDNSSGKAADDFLSFVNGLRLKIESYFSTVKIKLRGVASPIILKASAPLRSSTIWQHGKVEIGLLFWRPCGLPGGRRRSLPGSPLECSTSPRSFCSDITR